MKSKLEANIDLEASGLDTIMLKKLLNQEDLNVQKSYLQWKLIRAASSYLSDAFAAESFDFQTKNSSQHSLLSFSFHILNSLFFKWIGDYLPMCSSIISALCTLVASGMF